MEIFADIPGFIGRYQISNQGRVKSLPRVVVGVDGRKCPIKGRIMSTKLDRDGYEELTLNNKGKYTFRVHVLMAITFYNHLPCGQNKVVDHKDNDRTNNTLSNLQIISGRENGSKDRTGLSKHTGVCWSTKANKWQAQMVLDGKKKFLGYHNTEELAAKAYQDKLLTLTN